MAYNRSNKKQFDRLFCVMKQTLTLFITLIFGVLYLNAQISLKGVVTVQNSKTNTGKTEYVSHAQITCDKKAQPKTSDSKGEFTLEISGKQNEQIAITVIPMGKYESYVVVNEKEIKDLTLGRVTPVNVYVCKKGELEQRQAEMVGVNMQKLEERLDKERKRLQKEFNELKSKNDYLNVRYREIKDSLNAIDDMIDQAFEKIKEYAQIMTLENLDDRDENYVKAYHCFLNGNLDSVSYYLRDDYLDKKYEKVLQLQKDAKKEKGLATALTESAKAKEEFSANSLNELINEWLLLARTHDMKNEHEKAKAYYEKTVKANPTNANNIFEFAKYLHKIKEYTNAEKHYQQCLEISRRLEQENPKKHLSDITKNLNNLALIHQNLNEFPKALKEFEEDLDICRKLAAENPGKYLPDVATTLNNLAILHSEINEYPKALEGFEEALNIYRKLVVENSKAYLSDVAITLNNLANFHTTCKEYPKALKEYEEALNILRKLDEKSQKIHLSDVAMTLNNLGILHSRLKEYPKALIEFEEALQIRKNLAKEIPKIYLPDVAKTLSSLGSLYLSIYEYPKALTAFEEALNIYEKLDEKTHLYSLIAILGKISITCNYLNDYVTAIKYTYICNDLLLTYQKQINYKPVLIENYGNLTWYYLFTKEYAKSEQFARQALELDSASFAKINLAHALLFQNRFSEAEAIYKELSKFTQLILDDLETLEKEGVVPEERKADVEKIRKILKPN